VTASVTVAVGSGGSGGSGLPYQVVDLGPNFYPTAISQVPVNGGSVIVVGQLGTHAAMWMDNRMTDLHPLLANNPAEPNDESIALGVGTGVVGYKVTGIGYTYGFWFVNGAMDDWSLRPGYGKNTRANAVNYQGQIAAEGTFPDPVFAGSKFTGGALWENGTIKKLPSYGGNSIDPVGIQTDLLGNHAVMLGNTLNGSVIVDAMTGSVQPIPGMTQAVGFSSHNQVFDLGDNLWNGAGSLIPASTIPHTASFGFDAINNTGFAVGAYNIIALGLPGQYSTGDMRAIRLNDFLPDATVNWTLSAPTAINDAGYIAGVGTQRGGGQRAFLLVPTFTAAAQPNAPANLTGKHTSSIDVQLNWSDTSDNEYWFEIEGRTVTGNFQYVGAAPANATTFSVSATDKTIFRIRSRSLVGTSAYSNVVTVQ
jgi:hypothetical protein